MRPDQLSIAQMALIWKSPYLGILQLLWAKLSVFQDAIWLHGAGRHLNRGLAGYLEVGLSIASEIAPTFDPVRSMITSSSKVAFLATVSDHL